MEIDQVKEEYIKSLRYNNYSAKTCILRKYGIELFIDFIKNNYQNKFTSEIKKKHVENFLLYMYSMKKRDKKSGKRSGERIAHSSRKNFRTSVKMFLLFCFEKEYTENDFSILFPKEKDIKSVIVKHFNQKEMDLILSYEPKRLSDKRDLYVIELIYFTGIRIGEVINLELSHVDLQMKVIHIYQGKGAKDRTVPICKTLLEKTKNYLKYVRPYLVKGKGFGGDYFILGKSGKMKIISLEKRFRQLGLSLGFKKMTPHMFRHTFSVHMMRGGCDIKYISSILGHERIKTTETYTNIVDNDLRNQIENFHFWNT